MSNPSELQRQEPDPLPPLRTVWFTGRRYPVCGSPTLESKDGGWEWCSNLGSPDPLGDDTQWCTWRKPC